MHWVDRGPEPEGLVEIQVSHTPRWVRYYVEGVGNRPTDSYWRCFHDDLERVFASLCAYCEEIAKGEVEHFRPKSKFPDLVYSWSNWLFACHECNQAKSNTWPSTGYVNPCATSLPDRPERHFVFDTQTGLILPNRSLNPCRRKKAHRTINDLGLNDAHHLKRRVEWLKLFSSVMPDDPKGLTAQHVADLTHYASREVHLSSLVRAWLSENGYPMEYFNGE